MIKQGVSIIVKPIKQIGKVQNDVILIVQKWDNWLWTTYYRYASWIFVITVMQIIGYKLDTEMNITYFRPELMNKSLILWSEFDRQSWAGQLLLWRSMSMAPITRKPMLAYNADVTIHTSLPPWLKSPHCWRRSPCALTMVRSRISGQFCFYVLIFLTVTIA